MSYKLNAQTIVRAINLLPKAQLYHYVNPKNKCVIKICRVDMPEGPIVVKRWNPSKGQSEGTAKEDTISAQMIWRLANACDSGQPVNVDRVFGGSYNTRSVLEALVANTPEFHVCRPGRIETIGEITEIKKGHKHII